MECREFRRLALELLEQCYHQDDDKTLQLLTYELQNWGRQTCLSLAVIANNKVGSYFALMHMCRNSWRIRVVKYYWRICGTVVCVFDEIVI
jgi:hypothetical protein